MKKINILIVEDEREQIEQWDLAISQFNRLAIRKEHHFTFYHEFAENHEAAKEKLRIFSFVTAVVDIRLASGNDFGHLDTSGNEVLRDILNSSICLVAVYTGQHVDAIVSDQERDFIKVIDKSEMTKRELLESLVSQKELIDAIIDIKNTFSKSKASFFYSSIWPRWKFWLEEETTSAENHSALKRHMATHLHASFLNEVNQKAHPEEYFFIPPLREELDTGDMFRYPDGKIKLLITPRCELSQDKHETLQLVRLEDASAEWKVKTDKVTNATNAGKIKSAEDSLRRFSNHNNNSASYHFIPEIRLNETTKIGPFFARFNKLESMDKTEVEEVDNLKLIKFATLSNEFVPSLVERLGNFFSRIGDPDYSHPE